MSATTNGAAQRLDSRPSAPDTTVLGPLWALLSPAHRATMRGALVVKAVQAGLAAAPIVLLGPLLADVADGGADPAGWTAVYLAVLLIEVAAAIAANRVLFASCYGVGADLRHRLVDHLDDLAPGALDDRGTDGPSAVVTRDVSDVETFISGSLPPLIATSGIVAALALGLIVLDPSAGAVAIAAGAAATLVGRMAVHRFAVLGVQRTVLRAAVDERVSEHVDGIAVSRSLGRGAAELDLFATDLAELRDANLAATRRVIPTSSVRSSLLWAGPAAVLALLSFRAGSSGGVDGPEAVAALVVSLALAIALDDVLARTGSLPGVAASLRRISGLLDLPGDPAVTDVAIIPVADEVAVELHDVHAGYGDTPVLRGCTLTAPAGQVTAIVGPSGAGKTTVLRVIAGFLQPACGTVTIAGVPADALSRQARRDLIGMVPQEVRLVQGSIAANIAFGRPHEDRAAIDAAARVARVDTITGRSEAGLDSQVGVGGGALSGGERQRIAIARAVLDDAPLLLLDEATSALDATNERLVQEALAGLAEGRTVIVVAHRISTLRRADHVVVIEDGRVVEQGPPTALLAAGGPFSRLFAERSGVAGWRLEA